MIPKIIHQTWKDNHLPESFRKSAQSWQDYHPDWEYRLWTDIDLENFVKETYPEIWPLYASYPYQIQRVDAARYMILYHYGGIYSDLDIICNHSFESLLSHGGALAPTKPTGYSNDLMMVQSQHPLFQELINSLSNAYTSWQKPWLLRHFKVMLTTGPLFLSRVSKNSSHLADIYLFSEEEYRSQNPEKSWVLHIEGDTWMEWDSFMLKSIYRSWKRITKLIRSPQLPGN